jgi:hypothetical protein
MSLANWMGPYQDRKLNQLIMPGAHDAGTAKGHINKTLCGSDSNSATQDKTFWQMLECGVRFFDVRLKASGGKVVAHHTTLKQGAKSKDSIDETLGRISDWCYGHRTELVIVRISHTDANTRADQIVRASVHEDVLNKSEGNLCTKTVGEILRDGNLVVILENGSFSASIDQKVGLHGFKKHSPGAGSYDSGIMVCGSYKGTHTIGSVISTGLGGQAEHSIRHGAGPNCNHLWQLYWQKTYMNPLSTTGIERGSKKAMSIDGKGKVHGGTHATLDYMINLMLGTAKVDGAYKWDEKTKKKGSIPGFRKTTVERHSGVYISEAAKSFTLPNIISYDFVEEGVNSRIVDLNTKAPRVPMA